MNETKLVPLNREECCGIALELFCEEAGIKKEGIKYDQMRMEAFEIRKNIESRIDIKAAYVFYDEFMLEGADLTVNNQTFHCKAFELISRDSLEGVFAYALTTGDFHLEDKPIIQQVYADIWGTAFTDAIRGQTLKYLRRKQVISDSFGPGFYGMDVSEMKKMPRIIDFNILCMKVKESGVIIPLKSSSGILFKINEKYKRMDDPCKFCCGNARTCSLCSIRNNAI